MDSIAPHLQFLDAYIDQKIIAVFHNEMAKMTKPSKSETEWVSKATALELLGVKATTLYNLCRKGAIQYSYPSERVKLYNRQSIQKHISQKAV